MQTRQRLIRPQAKPSDNISSSPHGGIPNSAMLAMLNTKVQPEDLSALPSREISPTSQLNSEIQSRLGVPMPGMKIFETDGLMEQFGQRAYAQGNEIHLACGEYSPNTQSGMNLIMHEASHILQQGSGMARGSGILQNSGLESMARSMIAPDNFTMPVSTEGMPIQGMNPFRAIARSHRAAIDTLNNNRADYDNMNVLKRAWWSLKNPIARIRASGQKNATTERNDKERDAINALTNQHAGLNNTAANYDILQNQYYSSGGQWQNDMPKEQKHADAYAGAAGQKWLGRISEVSGLASGVTSMVKQLKSSQYKIDAGIGGVDFLTGAADTATGIANAVKSGRTGNASESAAHSIDALGGMASMLTGGAAMLSLVPQLSILHENAAILPGAAAVTSGIQGVAGAVRFVSGTHAWRKMSSRLRAQKKSGAAIPASQPATPGIPDLTQQQLKRTLKQARSVARARTATSGLSTVSSALNASAGATSAAGVTAGIGLGLAGLGTLTNILKWGVDKASGAYRRKHTVDKELGLDDKIQELMSNQALGIKDKRMARQYALKAMGFNTGTRKEAFASITMQRAAALHQAAESGNKEAQGIIWDMGLYKHKGHYSLQGIAEKLGMNPEDSWNKQLSDAKRRNPFSKT